MFQNPSIDECEVFRVEVREIFSPTMQELSIYFYGLRDTVERIWVYESEHDRQDDLKHILKNYPQVKMG